jgi:succinate dehydrogenase / fumarate reductase cytochrome b subunit
LKNQHFSGILVPIFCNFLLVYTFRADRLLIERMAMPRQRYRWYIGSVAWFLHRITGVLLSLYLIIHIWVVRTIDQGPEGFNRVMAAVQSPLFLFFEVGLLGTVLYHSLNGARLLLIDTGWGVRHQKGLFVVLAGIAMAILLIGAVPILHLLEKTFPG